MKYEVWYREKKVVVVVADGFEKTFSGDLVFYRESKTLAMTTATINRIQEVFGDSAEYVERALRTVKRENVAIFAFPSWDSVREAGEQ